jgi:hypothetical protein
MARIFNGRYTADTAEPFVVFLIGMRLNKLWAVHQWLPTLLAMGPMLRTLFQQPKQGLLGAHVWFGWRQVLVVQYWRSFEALEHFAQQPSAPHLPAWKRFNQTIGANGNVGIWHETFVVEARQYECVYNNMPLHGLAQATTHVKAIGNRATARLRLGNPAAVAEPSPQSIPAPCCKAEQ